MNVIRKITVRFLEVSGAVKRYPVTVVFLLIAVIVNIVSIYQETENEVQLLSCAVGALLLAVLQMGYERFFIKRSSRIRLFLAGIGVTALYYYLLWRAPELSLEIEVRTAAVLLALFFAYMWVPVIWSRIHFNESFFILFKSFFISGFYAGVLFGGISLILAAIQNLIYPIGSKVFGYSATVVFFLFAPLFLFSQIPIFPGASEKEPAPETEPGKVREKEEEGKENPDYRIHKVASCSRFLEILISYIFIPLAEVFTIILLIYIVKTIRSDFWSNNLLEPMLVSYAVAMILIYLLSGNLTNKSCHYFRKIIPKILIPIVLFQLLASGIGIMKVGVTHTGYYVMLFGVFAVAAGVVMSVVKVEKNGILAAMLIGFSLVSILPPVDAFTISKWSQTKVLTEVLVKNEMLLDQIIQKKSDLQDEEKSLIVSSVSYLDRMNYTDEIDYLPDGFDVYEDFYDVFGFYEYGAEIEKNRSIVVFLKRDEAVELNEYEYMSHTYISSYETQQPVISRMTLNGMEYTLKKRKIGEDFELYLVDQNNMELIRFNSKEIVKRYQSYAVDNKEIDQENASFYVENEKIQMRIIVQEASMQFTEYENTYFTDFYIFMNFK